MQFAGSSLERRIADLTILYEVSRALQRSLEEEKALYRILTGVTHGRGLGFNRAFILLVDSREKVLKGRLAIGPSSPQEAAAIWQELRERRLTFSEILEQFPPTGVQRDLRVNQIVSKFKIPLVQAENPLVKIMKSHQVSMAAHGAFQPHDWPMDNGLVAVLGIDEFAAAPIFVADIDLGLLLADNAITRAPITPSNLKLLQIYAQAASAAIQNTRLYRKLMDEIAASENTNRTLRESQEHLLQAERLSTIGKTAALLAHEIRTPLVSIGGFARRLLRASAANDPRKEDLEVIITEVGRLERLVEEVLGFTRVAKPDLQDTDINSLIRGVVLTMQDGIEKSSIRAILDLDPVLPKARVDQFQMRQALMNLISNAADAMPSGGVLTISTSLEKDYYEIGIADTGVGIAREHWNKLFTPFFTTKTAGTGLGLAIVSQIIENHHGSLRFESIAGQGTSFHVRLAFDPQTTSTEPHSREIAKT